MAQAQRNEIDPHGQPLSSQDQGQGQGGYRIPAGSPIVMLQADLAQRLVQADAAADARLQAASPIDRLVHRLSAASGYIGLACGYGLAGLAIVHWLGR